MKITFQHAHSDYTETHGPFNTIEMHATECLGNDDECSETTCHCSGDDTPGLLAIYGDGSEIAVWSDAGWWIVGDKALEYMTVDVQPEALVSDDSFIEGIRRLLIAGEYEDVAKVVFCTSEWDNGFFFENSAAVILKSGERDEPLDCDSLSDEITEYSTHYAPIGSSSQLVVDIEKNIVDGDVYPLVDV